MEPTVILRDFEERDIDFIYRCKNDEKLNSMIVGQYHPFTYEEATEWVHGCMGEHETYKFWAIATNDEEQRIVGWVSLSNIDNMNKSACFHGIVIGDADYRDGFAWIETYLYIYRYAFEKLKLEKVYGSARVDHSMSQIMRKVMFGKTIELLKNNVTREGKFYDVTKGVLNSRDYFEHKVKGDYEFSAILNRIRSLKKEIHKKS